MATSPTPRYRLEDHGYRVSQKPDQTLDTAQLRNRCPLDNGRRIGEPKQSVGKLDLLPAELITEVLLSLDIPSLTTFRRVNRRSRALVDSLYKYSMIFDSCPDVLRAIISTDARHYDCATLFETLSTTKCACCGDLFGSYLYLITCERVCYLCFIMKSDYSPIWAASCSADSRKAMAHCPHLISLLGHPPTFGNVQRPRAMLLDRRSFNSETQARNGTHLLEPTLRGPLEYTSINSAPYFDSASRSAEWGFYCTHCKDRRASATNYRIKYTRDGFMSHLDLHA